ncbi:MAG TPA: hypothetical protein VN442_03090 [Bryobacteraceae bacterium]|nr:hypothetical protein [Bryobacteraceae bacterium]
MDNRLIRLAYTIEFLIALLAVFAVWGQVAGQAHLDLVFWYWKLGLVPAIAYACVRATGAAMEREHTWNSRTIGWVGVVVLLGLLAGMVTYYVHLYYEPQEEEETEEEEPAYTATRVQLASVGLRRDGLVHVKLREGPAHAHFTITARKLNQ